MESDLKGAANSSVPVPSPEVMKEGSGWFVCNWYACVFLVVGPILLVCIFTRKSPNSSRLPG